MMRSAWRSKFSLSSEESFEAVGLLESSINLISPLGRLAPLEPAEGASFSSSLLPAVRSASCNFPLSNMSATMSAPPMSFPPMKSWGMVGHLLYSLTASRTPGFATGSMMLTDSKLAPSSLRMPTVFAEKPHWGIAGEPFMKSSTGCFCTAAATASRASAIVSMPRTPARLRGAFTAAAPLLRQRFSAPSAFSGRLPAGISPPTSMCSLIHLSHVALSVSLLSPAISKILTLETMRPASAGPKAITWLATLLLIALDNPMYCSASLSLNTA
mmetsp:Transcript_104214/g.279953  ORF Transcript_104214/g.279953 Transcript_104214/m.279953 type:complete len:271 (+) Transcript_104214:286-1098(+)